MNFNLSLPARIGLNLVALLGGITVLRLGAPIFLPLIYAVLLATILWPSANKLHSYYKLPWTLASVISVAVLVLFNIVIVGGIVLAVPRLLQNVPSVEQLEQQYTSFREKVIGLTGHETEKQPNGEAEKTDQSDAKKKNITEADKKEEKKDFFDEYLPADPYKSRPFDIAKKTLTGDYILQAVYSVISYLSSYLWQFILVLFIVLFLLMEGRILTQRIVEIFGPSAVIQDKVVSALASMSKVVRDFLVWRTVINIVLAVLVGTVYQALGLRQGWIWGMVTGVLCYIPYIGPIIAAGPPMLDALIHGGPWIALIVLIFYTGVIILEGYVIVPLLMGRHMDLNATTVMLACLFWELVWGVPGLFLAMPLMGAMKSVCEHVPGWAVWANLMSAKEGIRVPVIPDHDPNRTAVMDVPVGTDHRGK
jgi:predicted PurR-regulated permease PerM